MYFTPQQVETIARIFFGKPNKSLSNKRELRFGQNGSRSVDLIKGVWYDHETGEGGDTFNLIKSNNGGADRDAFEWMRRHRISAQGNGNGNSGASTTSATDTAYDPTKDPFKNATKATFQEAFKKDNGGQFRIVKTWSYTDENGEELFQVCRKENGQLKPNGKPCKEYIQRHKDPSAPGRYIDNVKGVRQVPYRLPDLIRAASSGQIIFITEGEKCADAVIAIGGAALCNAMGAGKWPNELTPFLEGADVVLLPDIDPPGERHANFVADKLQHFAAQLRILKLPGLSAGDDVADWIKAGGTLEQLYDLVSTIATNGKLEPLPLFPPMPDAEAYPADVLGVALSRAADAIAAKVQVPRAMAAQSVLATASLASCTQCDAVLPFGQRRPLTLLLATVAASGDRKTTADIEALWPVRKHEQNLRAEYDEEIEKWRIEFAAWSAQKRKIEGEGKVTLMDRKAALTALGKEPEKPLSPFLIAGDPTIEGLTKNWEGAHAALGLFTAEGASFTGGHGMNEDNRLKTAAMLSELWDGLPIKRVRATDGITILPGRRLAIHIMIQPSASTAFLSNEELRDQGLLSRILVTRPQSLVGSAKPGRVPAI